MNPKYQRPCWPKISHATLDAAMTAKNRLLARGLSKDPARIHVYKCPFCSGWHVGHAARRRKKDGDGTPHAAV